MDLLIQQLAQELSLHPAHVEAVVTLLDEGNTIPFIARYRKEAHGSMSDDVLRELADRLNYLRNLAARREEIRKAIQTQGKLTAALSAKLNKADTLAKLEDLYRPYRPKRRTRATMAKEKGLEPLAAMLLLQQRDKGWRRTMWMPARGSRRSRTPWQALRTSLLSVFLMMPTPAACCGKNCSVMGV